MNNIARGVIGTAHYPQSYNSNVDTSKQSYFDRLSSNIKYYLQAWGGYNNQICFTLRDRKVVSTGVTQEMIKKLSEGIELPDDEMQLVNNLVKEAIGEHLFNKLTNNNLVIVSKLLAEPGENIENIKNIISSALFNEKLNLLDQYPTFLELNSEQLDKLVNVDAAELNFLLVNIEVLKNLDPIIIEKILAHKDANQIITLLNMVKPDTKRLNEILSQRDPVADLRWMISVYHA